MASRAELADIALAVALSRPQEDAAIELTMEALHGDSDSEQSVPATRLPLSPQVAESDSPPTANERSTDELLPWEDALDEAFAAVFA